MEKLQDKLEYSETFQKITVKKLVKVSHDKMMTSIDGALIRNIILNNAILKSIRFWWYKKQVWVIIFAAYHAIAMLKFKSR